MKKWRGASLDDPTTARHASFSAAQLTHAKKRIGKDAFEAACLARSPCRVNNTLGSGVEDLPAGRRPPSLRPASRATIPSTRPPVPWQGERSSPPPLATPPAGSRSSAAGAVAQTSSLRGARATSPQVPERPAARSGNRWRCRPCRAFANPPLPSSCPRTAASKPSKGPCIGGRPIGIEGNLRSTAPRRLSGPDVQKAPGGATEWRLRRTGDAQAPAAKAATGRKRR